MDFGAKICGITTSDALDAALEGGARFIGLVFHPASPRNVDVATAVELAERARGRASIVALTVDAENELLDIIVNSVKPDFLQLHGKESADRIQELKQRYALPVIKAVGVSDAKDIAEASAVINASDIVLYDAKPPRDAANPGGNGVAFDWSLLKNGTADKPFMVSGGLTAENVADAIRQTGAHWVDVSSGVESSRGEKDVALVRRFLDAVRAGEHC